MGTGIYKADQKKNIIQLLLCAAMLLSSQTINAFDVWNATDGDIINYYFGAGSAFTNGWSDNPCDINQMKVVKVGNILSSVFTPNYPAAASSNWVTVTGNTIYVLSGNLVLPPATLPAMGGFGMQLAGNGSCIGIVGASGTIANGSFMILADSSRPSVLTGGGSYRIVHNINFSGGLHFARTDGGANITFDGLTMTGSSTNNVVVQTVAGSPQASKNVFLRNIHINGGGGRGISILKLSATHQVTGILIDDVIITNKSSDGVFFRGYPGYTKITNSRISNNIGLGIQSQGGECMTGNLIIENSIIAYNNAGIVDCTSPMTVKNSIIAHNNSYGIGNTDKTIIYNTQIFNNLSYGIGIGAQSLLHNVLIYNNGGRGIVGVSISANNNSTIISNSQIFNNALGGLQNISIIPFIIHNSLFANNSGFGLFATSSGLIHDTTLINNQSGMSMSNTIKIYGILTGIANTLSGGAIGSSSDAMVASVGRADGQIYTGNTFTCDDLTIPYSGYYNDSSCSNRGRTALFSPTFPSRNDHIWGYKLSRQTQALQTSASNLSYTGVYPRNPLDAIAGGSSVFPTQYQPQPITYDLSISGSVSSLSIIGGYVVMKISYHYSGSQSISGVVLRFLLQDGITNVVGSNTFSQTGAGNAGTNYYEIQIPVLDPGQQGVFTITGLLGDIASTGIWLQVNSTISAINGLSISGDQMIEPSSLESNNRLINTLFVIDEDIIPENVSFIDIVDAPLSVIHESNIVVISGLNTSDEILATISGNNTSMFRIVRSGITGSRLSINQTGSVIQGDRIQLRMTSSMNNLSTVSMILNLGSGFNSIFADRNITTIPDNTPSAVFAPIINAEISTLYVSSWTHLTATQTGYWIQISGGEYALSGGIFGTGGISIAWTSGATYISGGQNISIQLRNISAPTYSTTIHTTITVGDLTDILKQSLINRSITTKNNPMNINNGGGGGGARLLNKDFCPEVDNSSSFYDNTCENQENLTEELEQHFKEFEYLDPISTGRMQCMRPLLQLKGSQEHYFRSLQQGFANLSQTEAKEYRSTMIKRIIGGSLSQSVKNDLIYIVSRTYTQSYFYAEPEFNDIEHIISWMYSNKVTSKESLETFMSSEFLTREQAAKFYTDFTKNLMCKVQYKRTIEECDFQDLQNAQEELRPRIVESCRLGLFKGVGNNTFDPKSQLTNEQAVTVLMKIIFGEQGASPEDMSRSEPYINLAVQTKLINNANDMTRSKSITRILIARWLYRIAKTI